MDFAKLFSEYWWIVVGVIILFGSLFTINQGYIGVITMFGKYRRIVSPGLNIKIPILETVSKKSFYSEPFSGTGISGGYIRSG